MAKKIYLSPSDQTNNRYAYGNTNEAVQCRRIADACETALERCGFEVKNNKTSSMSTRVNQSNSWGADLHLPIHTNAFNKKTTGTRLFSHDSSGEGRKACRAIYSFLAPLTPGESESVTSYPDLYEIKYTDAPCAYIECEFHDNAEAAKWIIEHVEEIGEAICQGVCKYFGVKYKAPVKSGASASATVTTDKISGTILTAKISLPVIRNGSEGPSARVAMVLLKDKGYYKSYLAASDDVFGPIAESATKAFQQAKKLDADGIIGEDTWAALLK